MKTSLDDPFEGVEFRLVEGSDSLDEITELLNTAYKVLLDMGLNYVAATQDSTVTQKRIKKAYKCFVGLYQNRIISTISLYKCGSNTDENWYSRNDVAKVGQFAVHPDFQKLGIGDKMMALAEAEGRKIEGVKELGLDTAETAHHLIAYYQKRGYNIIETIKWESANYKSVIMSKVL